MLPRSPVAAEQCAHLINRPQADIKDSEPELMQWLDANGLPQQKVRKPLRCSALLADSARQCRRPVPTVQPMHEINQ
jgi:hypothetical protein